MRTSHEGGTWSYLILKFAVAQKQIPTLCEMRKAKIWPPQWVSKFYEIVGNSEYYNEQGTQDNTHGDCWTTYQSSITGCEYCFMFDSPSRHNAHTMAPHVQMTRDGFSQRAPSSYHHRMSTSHFYLALTSWYGVVSWFLSGISLMTSYKINSLMVAWKLICMFGWRHYRTFGNNSINVLKIWPTSVQTDSALLM